MLATTLFVLLALIALSVPIAAALGVLGLILGNFYSMMPLHRAAGEIAWSSSTNFLLVAIPLFVMMGEILLRAGVAERMYGAMSKWLSWLPGGLMHSNVGASALFAATSGSSVATAATVGTVALPQVERQGYEERLFLGTIAAGGTLGILIPPSINMIIYGVLTETSVPQLYLAGILPGLLLAAFFMGIVIVACLWRPKWGGVSQSVPWGDRLRSLSALLPPLGIFTVVVGSIYAGIATPTEAAALGVMASLVLALRYGTLTVAMLREVIESTMRTTTMVMLIILAAYFLNFIMSGIGLTSALNQMITDLGWTPYETLFAVIAFYIVLGFFMETLSMMITTVPIIAPILINMGFDPVWFGVLLMVLLETALITPPIGINLYVVHGIRPKGRIAEVIVGAIPFVVAMFLMIGALVLFPDIATWLPAQFY